MYTPGMIKNFINDKVINKENILNLSVGNRLIKFDSREDVYRFLDNLESGTKITQVSYDKIY